MKTTLQAREINRIVKLEVFYVGAKGAPNTILTEDKRAKESY
jgi:hypothetical protein